jgi:hypothetical protein
MKTYGEWGKSPRIFAKRFRVALTLLTCIRDVVCYVLGQNSCWPVWGFSWFSSIPRRKCWDYTSISSLPRLLNPLQFIIHLPFDDIYWQPHKVNYKKPHIYNLDTRLRWIVSFKPPPRPCSAPLRHQNNGETGRIAFCVSRVQKDCQSCQRTTVTPLGDFTPPTARFLYAHKDLVGRLPTSAGYCQYVLPHCSRPFHPLGRSRPHPGHHRRHSDTRALLTGWLSRFGWPQTVTTDQGRQFESQLFHSMAKLCGIQLSQTTAHQAADNGLGERFHRTLKTAIICHADQHWTEALPLVLLGIRTAFREDLQAPVAERVYGEPLQSPASC